MFSFPSDDGIHASTRPKTHLRVPERAGVVKRDQAAVVTSVHVGARPQEVVHDVLTAKTCRSGQRSGVSNIPTEGDYFYCIFPKA